MASGSAFHNRLKKNARHFQKWAERAGLTAYRVYDRDMPEFPYTVDVYGRRVLLAEFPRKLKLRSGEAAKEREEVLRDVVEVLGVPAEDVFTKTHVPQKWGVTQYGRTHEGTEPFLVKENGLSFWVKLGDYLDTGLFMDHRNTRARIRAEAQGKRFLNLFAYTGSFTVYAAAGGAKETVTVDLSGVYLDWAAENLRVNGFVGKQHMLDQGDAAAWLVEARKANDQFDLIVLDPPSFSTSQRAARFEVQRDHPRIIDDAYALLAPGGDLYFSTNFRSFELATKKLPAPPVEELTPKSLPPDFHQQDIHRCFRFRRP